MLVIKFVILVLVFISSLWVGILIANKYSSRVKQLKDMKNALNMFETKIKFTYASVPEIFEDVSKQIDGAVGIIFSTACKRMKDISAGDAWCESIDIIPTNMNNEDKAILKNLGKLLGKTDIDGQVSEIRLVSDFLDSQIETAEIEKSKNAKMYKTLGGIIGLALIIICL